MILAELYRKVLKDKVAIAEAKLKIGSYRLTQFRVSINIKQWLLSSDDGYHRYMAKFGKSPPSSMNMDDPRLAYVPEKYKTITESTFGFLIPNELKEKE